MLNIFHFVGTVFDGLQPLLVPGTTCLHIELEVIECENAVLGTEMFC